MMADDNNIKLCRVSMCEPKTVTDIDTEQPVTQFVIEFGVQNPVIMLTEGQHINVDDVICYMNGKPVRSKLTGTITEVHERYIIGTYDTDIDDMLDDSGELTIERIKQKFNINI